MYMCGASRRKCLLAGVQYVGTPHYPLKQVDEIPGEIPRDADHVARFINQMPSDAIILPFIGNP